MLRQVQSAQSNEQLLEEAIKNLTDYKAVREPELQDLRDQVDLLDEYLQFALGKEKYWKEVSVEIDGYMIAMGSIGMAYDGVANDVTNFVVYDEFDGEEVYLELSYDYYFTTLMWFIEYMFSAFSMMQYNILNDQK